MALHSSKASIVSKLLCPDMPFLLLGDDATLLATAQAIEPHLPKTPPPSQEPPCKGCRVHVGVQPVSYSGSGQLEDGGTFSCYTAEVEGQCQLSQSQRPIGRL